jgi:hypothetical protein
MKNFDIHAERLLIEDSFVKYKIPITYRQLILTALDSQEWVWYKDCDGCTGVPDLTYMTYHPACIVHDYLWVTGRGGKVADKLFYNLMLLYQKGSTVSRVRYIAVRIAWLGYYKWKHKFNKNVKPMEQKWIKLSKHKISWK